MISKFEKNFQRLLQIEAKLKTDNKKFRKCLLAHYKSLTEDVLKKVKIDQIYVRENSKESEFKDILKAISDTYNNITTYLKFHAKNSIQIKFKTLAQLVIIFNRYKQPKMETFDIKTATALVQIYDGNTENFDNFVDSATLLKELSPKDSQMLIKFLKTRLTGKARLGLPPNINTFDDLINDLKARCQEKVNPDKIVVQLKSICNRDTKSLCEEVETLCVKLKNSYLQQEIPEKVANEMALKMGINTLIEKVSNPETKILLKARQFSNVSEATEKILENEEYTDPSQILSFHTTRYRGNRNFRSHNRFFNKPSQNNYNSYPPKAQNQRNYNRYNSGRNNRYNHGNQTRGNFNNNNQYRGNFNNNNNRTENNRVYSTQTSNNDNFLEDNQQPPTDCQSLQ